MNKTITITILATIFLLKTSKVFSQYDSLVVDHAVWIINGDDPLNTPWPIDIAYGYYLDGDTVYNAMTYKKVYRLILHNYSQTNVPNYNPYAIDTKFLYALIREDNKRIYAVRFFSDNLVDPLNHCIVNSEYLLHDYNVLIGDTVHECNMTSYAIIDSIAYPSVYGHKAFLSQNFITLLEGIGSGNGLFENFIPNVSGFWQMWLNQYCKGDLQYCGLGFVSINENNFNSTFLNIFPNPSTHFCNISAKSFVHSTLKIYDLTGRVLLQQNINEQARINVSALKEGMYVVEVRDEGRSVKGKLIRD